MSANLPLEGPISVSAVQSVLGVTDNSIAALCQSSNINLWALRRPIVHTALYNLTDAQRKAANFGFSLPQFSLPTALLTALGDGSAWSAKLPNGTYPTQPCRLGDFRGYAHNAKQFVEAPSVVSLNDDTDSYLFFSAMNVTPADGLLWTQMFNLAAMYPCVVLFNEDGTVKSWKTADGTFSSLTDHTVTVKAGTEGITFNDLFTTKYRFMMCAASAKRTSFTASAPTTYFRAIPANPALVGVLNYTKYIGHLKVTFLGVLGGSSAAKFAEYSDTATERTFTFLDASLYAGMTTEDGGTARINVGSPAKIAMLVKIENTATSGTASSTYRKLHATNTSNVDKSVVASVYNVDSVSTQLEISLGTRIPQGQPMQIPHGTSKYFVIYGGFAELETAEQDEFTLELEWKDKGYANVHITPNPLRVKFL